jgi:hypothetical protein
MLRIDLWVERDMFPVWGRPTVGEITSVNVDGVFAVVGRKRDGLY